MKITVSPLWLKEKMQSEHVLVLDGRYEMDDPGAGYQQYEERHLPQARFFDLSETFMGEVASHGGRHPLPPLETLIRELGELGISGSETIVVYDGGSQEAAARAWFILHYAGCEKVFVLDGGFKRWTDEGFETTSKIPTWQPVSFKGTTREELVATMQDVRQIVEVKCSGSVLIDSRAAERYRGEVEPIDAIAGHIPTAINLPWQASLDDTRMYLSVPEQKERLKDVAADAPLVVYCGSGITASVNFIALREAGFENVRLYAGSYSDWISYPENKVE